MRTVIRTMLAAAAGAALIASGTTVVRLSEPAFAETGPVVSAPTARPGLVPGTADEPAGPGAPVVPDPQPTAPTAVEPQPEPAPRPERPEPEPVRRSEPAPPTPARPAPATGATVPAAAPVPADPPAGRAPAEQPDDELRNDPADPDDTDTAADDEPDRERPSLLGRLTEPLGVTCGGLLRRVCD